MKKKDWTKRTENILSILQAPRKKSMVNHGCEELQNVSKCDFSKYVIGLSSQWNNLDTITFQSTKSEIVPSISPHKKYGKPQLWKAAELVEMPL